MVTGCGFKSLISREVFLYMQIVQIIAISGSLVLFVFVIDFIRRNLLKGEVRCSLDISFSCCYDALFMEESPR